MANCCSKSTQSPTVISGQKDLGKGSVKLKEKFKKESSSTRYKKHPPEERGSLESIYKCVPAIPIGNNTPIPMRKEFNIPIEHRRNSR